MKYISRKLSGNINVSSTHPLIELLWLASGLVLIVGGVFFTLGFLTDQVVSRIPVNAENWIGERGLNQFSAKEDDRLTTSLNNLLAVLPPDKILDRYAFQVYLADSEQINALALPGGKIVVFRGLIEQVESENELSMVLGHELGHFAQRDHLRGLGRGLGAVVITMFLFGPDSSAGDLVANTLLNFQADYSQDQESGADQFGLELLVRYYGHAGGSTDFFSRLAKENESRIPYLLASHPHPGDRIEYLKQLIEENHYPVRETVSLLTSSKEKSD